VAEHRGPAFFRYPTASTLHLHPLQNQPKRTRSQEPAKSINKPDKILATKKRPLLKKQNTTHMIEFWQHFKQGNELIVNKNYSSAKNMYELALQNASDHKEAALALEMLSVTSIRKGDVKDGIRYLEDAINADPDSPHANRMSCALARQHSLCGNRPQSLAIQRKLFTRIGWARAIDANYDFTKELWFVGNHKTFDAILKRLNEKHDAIVIAEIGSFQGMSICYMNDNIPLSKNAKLICIDPNFQPEFRSNINQSINPKRVVAIEEKSHDYLHILEPKSIHMVHVDGWHVAPQVFIDGLLSVRVIGNEGFIVFDDYLKEDQTRLGQTVKMGVDAFMSIFGEWLDVVVEGRQLVCQLREDVDWQRAEIRLKCLLRNLLPHHSYKINSQYFGDIYDLSLSCYNDLLSVSWDINYNIDLK
jgi:predicted O-methyltransferase YrrM